MEINLSKENRQKFLDALAEEKPVRVVGIGKIDSALFPERKGRIIGTKKEAKISGHYRFRFLPYPSTKEYFKEQYDKRHRR